jgi:hypothetical protein
VLRYTAWVMFILYAVLLGGMVSNTHRFLIKQKRYTFV